MTTSTVTLVGDVSDLIGNDYDPSRTKVWVQHNTDKVVTDSGPIRLGAATKAVGADGTFSFANVVASTSLVTNLQATLWVDWPNTAGPERTRRQVSFGPYDLTGLSGTVDIRTLEATQALDPVASSALLSEMQDLRDEQVAISGIDSTDTAVAYAVQHGATTPGVLSASMAQQFLSRGSVNFTGSPIEPLLTVANDTDQYTMHLLAAAGNTAPGIIGLGVNEDYSTGVIADMTNPGTKGMQVNLLAGTDSASRGIQLQNFGLGTLIDAATYDTAGPILTAVALGTPAANQKMIHLETLAIAGRGYFGPSLLDVYADTGIIDVTAPKFRVNGGRLSVQAIDVGYAGNKPRVNIDGGGETFAASPFLGFYGTATSTTYFASRITPNGQTMKLQGADGHSAEGAHTWGTPFLEGGYVAGLPVWAFNGQSPTSTAAVTGSRGGNAAVASLITALAAKGIVLDSTTA